MAAVRAAFKPEFINRLDDVIDLRRRSSPRSWCRSSTSSWHSCRSGWLSDGCTSRCRCPPRSGWPSGASTRSTARGRCARLVQQAIGDQLAKMLLAGEVHDGDVVPVNVSADGEGLVLG